MTVRGWAWISLIVLLAALAVVALVMVPWHRPPAPRSDQLAALAQLPADRVAKGRQLHDEMRWITYPSMVIGVVFALLLGLTPLGAKIVAAVPGPWLAKVLGGGLLVLFAADVVTLPLAAWRHTILVRYGLSTQDWSAWSVDLLKGYAVGAVMGAVALLGFFGLTRLFPTTWWAWGAVGAAGLVVLLSFVFPVLVEPLFNKFTPMAESPLRTELMARWRSVTACRCAMCLSPMPPGAPLRSTPTSAASAPRGASSSTTRCSGRRRKGKWSVSSRMSWATPRTRTWWSAP